MQDQQGQLFSQVSRVNVPGKRHPVRNALNLFVAVFGLICLMVLCFSLWDISHRSPKEVGLDPGMMILIEIAIPLFGILCTIVGVYLQVHVALTVPPSSRQSSTTTQLDAALDNFIPPISASIHGIFPYISQKVVLQHKKVVRELVRELHSSDITALVLTGLAGIGKSTLAALIDQYYRTSGRSLVFLRKSFAVQPLRLTITEKVTFMQIAETLLKYLGHPVPANFSSLSPEDKVFVVIYAMENAKKRCLAILDQFDNWLEGRTGYALPKYPEVDIWLRALNSQKYRCHLLLTSRVFPRARPEGGSGGAQAHLDKYIVSDLGIGDGMKLLRLYNVYATEAELHFIVKQCGGHAGALAELAVLLESRPTLSLNTPRCISLWREALANKFLNMHYLKQLRPQEYDLLIAFSVYRTEVSLETALRTTVDLISEEIWNALDILIHLHLLQKVGSGYRLHPVVALAMQEHLERMDKQTLLVLHENAARYYQGIGWQADRKERPRKALMPLIETIWHLGLAERWKDAYTLLEREGLAGELERLGEGPCLLELYQTMLPIRKWNPSLEQERCICEDLCNIYEMLDRINEAERYRQEASRITQEIQNWREKNIS